MAVAAGEAEAVTLCVREPVGDTVALALREAVTDVVTDVVALGVTTPAVNVPQAQTLSMRYVPPLATGLVPLICVVPAFAKTAQHAFGWLFALAGSGSVGLVAQEVLEVSVDVTVA